MHKVIGLEQADRVETWGLNSSCTSSLSPRFLLINIRSHETSTMDGSSADMWSSPPGWMDYLAVMNPPFFTLLPLDILLQRCKIETNTMTKLKQININLYTFNYQKGSMVSQCHWLWSWTETVQVLLTDIFLLCMSQEPRIEWHCQR